jgi:hypothetical protein
MRRSLEKERLKGKWEMAESGMWRVVPSHQCEGIIVIPRGSH